MLCKLLNVSVCHAKKIEFDTSEYFKYTSVR